MCRLVAVVTNEETDFRLSLHEAPRSLAMLSGEHPHGWGVAVYSPETHWTVHKGPACARDDAEFHAVAAGSRGEVLVAHIRNRTVGPVTVENTHPFRHGHWVFAHNGTIRDMDYLRTHTSPMRQREIIGETDSELFFAFVLTRLDDAGLTDAPAGPSTDAALRDVVREVTAREDFGAVNFLLADGAVVYAHRYGRTLYLLEKHPADAVRRSRESLETGAVLETPWSQHRTAVLVASEAMTDEPWQALDEGTLLRIDRTPVPRWRLLA